MSVMPHIEPEPMRAELPGIALVLGARVRALGDGLTVRRLLPSISRRMVGPFIFFDHMGPVRLEPGSGVDVRPHPHINLATVTYLFEGELLHRDSIGSERLITPGAVNWMTAGRGIVHSERSPAAARSAGPGLHGLQLWVALPTEQEAIEPSFQHHAASDVPEVSRPGVRLRVIAGTAFGVTSPVTVFSEIFYVDAQLETGAELQVPEGYAGRAAYVVTGSLGCEGSRHGEGTMLVLREGARVRLTAAERTRAVLLGGALLDGERHTWWNFVSSSIDRIDKAKADWREGRFPRIPGDDKEFVPLPADVGRPR